MINVVLLRNSFDKDDQPEQVPFLVIFCTFLSTHANRQRVDISSTVCLCVCNTWLWISPARIKLVVSNSAGWFRGILSRESPILRNFAPPEAQNWTNRHAAASIADRRQSPPLTARLQNNDDDYDDDDDNNNAHMHAYTLFNKLSYCQQRMTYTQTVYGQSRSLETVPVSTAGLCFQQHFTQLLILTLL